MVQTVSEEKYTEAQKSRILEEFETFGTHKYNNVKQNPTPGQTCESPHTTELLTSVATTW